VKGIEVSKVTDFIEALSRGNPGEGILIEARECARDLQYDGRPVFSDDSAARVLLTAAIAGFYKRENEALRKEAKDAWSLVELIRLYYPDEFENLRIKSLGAGLRYGRAAEEKKLTPRQRYERRLARKLRWEVEGGEIEREFWWRGLYKTVGKQHQSIVPDTVNPLLKWLPDCCLPWSLRPILYKILDGETISLPELQELFGLLRKHFPDNLPRGEDGRYGYPAVDMIVKFLFSKTPEKKRKKSMPGRAKKKLWFRDPARRARWLGTLELKLNDPTAPRTHIAEALMHVVHDYKKVMA
jgi:hypothetical protein